MEFSRRSGLFAAAAAAIALSLTACGSAAPEAASTSPAAAEAAFPVTVEHIYGTTKIPKKPERIATVSWVNADAVLALGVVPVGMASDVWGNNAKNSTDWKDAKLEELGAPIGSEKAPVQYSEADGVNFTAIAEVQPDLIVAGYSGLTKDEYEKLSKIAPVIGPVAPNYTSRWQDVTSAVGKALGKDTEAKTLISDLEGKLTAAGEANPVFKETTFIAGNLEPADGGINLYASGDNRPRFLSALGMTQAKIVDENVKAGEFYLPWSAERANELDSDIFFTWIPAGSSTTEITENKLFAQIPAVSKGGLVAVDSDMDVLAVSATSPLSVQWAIDKVVPKLAAAAQAASGK
ncbi:ABC transporter substrate-binding protein [Paeniglutamicibacter sp. NPDC012692]|uniref:ABC transporter substrate-binding protein n=1 Tax=Paeniglutamicibacter sp. NPDC012692 TaxID=3364388 RepID=UPI0036BC2AEF